jgi:putative two-component system response regulator
MTERIRKPRILIVDPAPESVRSFIEETAADFEISITTGARKALELAAAKPAPDLILLDIRAPSLEGFQVCRRLKAQKRTRDIPIIFITAQHKPSHESRGLALQAVDYIVKPFSTPVVKARIFTHVELRRHRDNLEKIIRERTAKFRKVLDQMVKALTLSVEKKDPYTSGHQQRVSQLACAMAIIMGLSDDQIDGISIAGLLHDIGKISIPSEILSKPGRLTELEFNLLKEHPRVGAEILEGVEFPWPVSKIVLQHHERMDGSGYPFGISGDDILLESRIIAVADVVEAMSTHRPYRPTLGIGAAIDEISEKRGIWYDTRAVDACVRLLEKKRKYENDSKTAVEN